MRSAIYHHSVLVGLLLAAPMAAAAPPADPGAVLSEVWLQVADAEDLQRAASIGLTVAEGRRIDSEGGIRQRVIASPRAMQALRSAGYRFEIARADHRRGAPLDGYRGPEQGDGLLARWVHDAPRAGLVQLGESYEGRPILGAWFGQHPDSGAPALRVLAAHHGDEWSSFEVALDLAHTVAYGDGQDGDLTALLDTRTLWIVPYVNPDGIRAGSRYNAAGVDLNRNYGFEWSEHAWRAGEAPFSEPETRAVRTHAAFGAPYASLTLHSGAQNIGYVWNWSRAATPEEPLIADLAQVYEDACSAPDFYATNGADWYVTTGDTNDWSYGRYGSLDFTVELTDTKSPSADTIETFLDWHDDAVRAFLDTPVTWAGTVVDEGGEPVAAGLRWQPDAGEAVAMAAHPVTGAFHRYTVPTGTLTVDAPGFETRAVPLPATAPVITLTRTAPAPTPVSPRLATGGGVVEVTWNTDAITLERPGFASHVVPVADGRFEVPPDIAPGFWNLRSTAGDRAFGLFVADDGPAGFDLATLRADRLTMLGSGFAVGTRAWAVTGPRSRLTPVPIPEQSDTHLVMDLSGLADLTHTDVLVLSNGTQLAVLDVDGRSSVDTGDFVDTGTPLGPPVLERGSCSCATSGGGWTLLWLPLILLWRRSP